MKVGSQHLTQGLLLGELQAEVLSRYLVDDGSLHIHVGVLSHPKKSAKVLLCRSEVLL